MTQELSAEYRRAACWFDGARVSIEPAPNDLDTTEECDDARMLKRDDDMLLEFDLGVAAAHVKLYRDAQTLHVVAAGACARQVSVDADYALEAASARVGFGMLTVRIPVRDRDQGFHRPRGFCPGEAAMSAC